MPVLCHAWRLALVNVSIWSSLTSADKVGSSRSASFTLEGIFYPSHYFSECSVRFLSSTSARIALHSSRVGDDERIHLDTVLLRCLRFFKNNHVQGFCVSVRYTQDLRSCIISKNTHFTYLSVCLSFIHWFSWYYCWLWCEIHNIKHYK